MKKYENTVNRITLKIKKEEEKIEKLKKVIHEIKTELTTLKKSRKIMKGGNLLEDVFKKVGNMLAPKGSCNITYGTGVNRDIVCFSDEEGYGYFLKHYKDKDGIFKDKKNPLFVFLGDAVDRGRDRTDGHTKELELLELLIKLKESGDAILIAGNRDINKLRMRKELALAIGISNPYGILPKLVDAYDVVYNIINNSQDIESIKNKIEEFIKIFFPNSTEYKYTYTQNELNLNPQILMYVTLAYQWLTRLDTPDKNHTLEFIQSQKKTPYPILTWNDNSNYDNDLKNNSEWYKKHISNIINETKYNPTTTTDANTILSRVVKILNETMGITINDKNQNNWKKWAINVLQPKYHGLYLKYLSHTVPYYIHETENRALFFSHTFPDKDGINTNWGKQKDTLSKSYDLPIQSLLDVNDTRIINMSDNCSPDDINITKNIHGIYRNLLLKAYYGNDTNLYNLIGLVLGNEKNTSPKTFKNINCLFKNKKVQEIIFVHGHKPFAIPYIADVSNKENKKIYRISVDVSRDGVNNGDDNNKNWAYVTFNAKDGNTITAIGMRGTQKYTIDNMYNVKIDKLYEHIYLDTQNNFPVLKDLPNLPKDFGIQLNKA